MKIETPELSLIALIGKNESEKICFLEKYFIHEEVFGIDELRDYVAKRLEEGKLTVVNVEKAEEKNYQSILKLAKKNHCMPIAIVLDGTLSIDGEEELNHLVEALQVKGFKKVYVLDTQDKIENSYVQRTKLTSNKRDIHGPFDIIGDAHGCYDELSELLEKLGYKVNHYENTAYSTQKRKVIFLGDLVDRGPKVPEVLKLVMSMVKTGQAYCVIGNHDGKLQRKLKGSNVQIAHGLEKTLEQFAQEPEAFIAEVKQFLDNLASHYVFDEGKLVVAHAGLREKLHGRESAKIRDLAMFGETTGELDELGLPIRLNWSTQYEGEALIVYGHTPQAQARMINNTINVDTGCVYGGKLTAFRYPEKEIVSVDAKAIYYESARPLA